MFSLPFNLLVLGSALASIIGDQPNNRWGHYVFKPVTMLLLIGAVVMQGTPDTLFAQALLVGLAFSLLGDIFLMLPQERFIEGLASFLVAHIAYIIGFYQLYEFNVNYIWIAALVVFALGFFSLLAPHLGKLKLPVIVYICVIITMVWMSGELFFHTSNHLSITLFIGAISFACSDSILAFNKFKRSFKGAQCAILLTYFFAQWMFAQAILI